MKVLIDLDVFTTALWDRKKEAMEFLERARAYDILKSKILLFSELEERIKERSKLPLKELTLGGTEHLKIKTEDLWLVFFASAYGLVLVTYNKKHLRNKIKEINEYLASNNLDKIEIKLPGELPSSGSKLFFYPLANFSLPFTRYLFPGHSLFVRHVHQLLFYQCKHMKQLFSYTDFKRYSKEGAITSFTFIKSNCYSFSDSKKNDLAVSACSYSDGLGADL